MNGMEKFALLTTMGAMGDFMHYTHKVSDMLSAMNHHGSDPNANRKARKERARMLTAQRMAEIQAQGGNCKRKKKRK